MSREIYDHAVTTERTTHAAVTEAEQGVALAESRRQEAQAAVEQAHAALAEAESGPHQVEASRAQRRLAEAKVAQARAALDFARSQLEDTVVKAPSDGLIGKKDAEVGETVQPGQPLVALVPLSQIWITANFKETQIAQHDSRASRSRSRSTRTRRPSMATWTSIGAATGSKFSLLPAENATGNYVKVVQRVPVRIALDPGQDPDHRLRPGMSVVPTVSTE